MKLSRCELAEHSAAARLFSTKLFLAEKGWDIEADLDRGIIWVAGKNAQGKEGRWFIPLAQVVYGEPAEVQPVRASDAAHVPTGLAAHRRARHP